MKQRRKVWAASLATALALSVAAVSAEPATVLGDSIGVGISMAGGTPRLAHNSVTIRGSEAVQQIGRMPADSVAVLSLGTNDAVGSIAGVDKAIDRIVDASERSSVRLVWVGPPCVRKSWNSRVQALDAILRARLADRVAYVSIADPAICDPRLRAGDGVHFTMKGYEALWARVSAALPTASRAGGPSTAPAAPPHRVAAAIPPARAVP